MQKVHLLVKSEENPMVIEHRRHVALDQIKGGFDVAGLYRAPDLVNEEARSVGGGGGSGGGRRGRGRRGGGIF